MSIQDNFGNPQGLLGRIMLSGMNMGHTAMAKWGFTQFEVPSKADAVDIGCGGGYNVKRLLERITDGHVYGVDISGTSVAKSKAANRSELGKRCDIYQAGADKLPFKDSSLDLATAFETVYFWKDIPACFAEVRRVLRHGGCFAVINDPGDPDKHWENLVANMTVYTPEEIADAMGKAGFIDIKITKNKNMYCVTGRVL